MVNKKIDPVSRVVAFITAFAIAMLTVTLIHRTVISAEEAHDTETTYSEKTSVADYEATIASETEITDGTEGFDSETDASSDSTNTSANETDTSLNGTDTSISETDASLPENTEKAPIESESSVPEYNAAMFAVNPLADKVKLPANDIIIPKNLQLTTGTGHILQDGTVVRQGDTVRLDFNWEIDNSDTSDYSNTIFQYDITDHLKGIKLDDGYKPYIVEGVLKAEYRITTTEDNRTIISIEPKSGFGAEYTDRSGSIVLTGKVDLSGYKKETSDITLEYFDKEVKVKAPELAPVLYVNKESVDGIKQDGTDYYQRYRITVKNDSDAAQNKTTLLEMPGKIFTKDEPTIVSVEDSSGVDITDRASVIPDANVAGQYKIALDTTIEKGQYVTIEYKMKIDQSIAFNPNTTYDDTKNEVRIEREDGEQSYPSSVWIDLSRFRPTITKDGIFDESNKNIIWTITVSGNFMGEADFTVTDTPSGKLTSNDVKAAIEAALKKQGKENITVGNDLILKKEAFEEHDNGLNQKTYVLEYTTPVPSNTKKGESFVNDVTLKYPGSQNNNAYTDQAVCKYDINIDRFAEKSLLNITDDSFEWEVKVTPKPYNGNDISQIIVKDLLNQTQYGWDAFTFEEITIEIAGKTFTVIPDPEGNKNFSIYGLGEYSTGWKKMGEATVTITDSELLKQAVNNDITVKFKTKVKDDLNINDITYLLNIVNCNIKYSNGDEFENRATAEYKTSFGVSKNLEYNDVNGVAEFNKDALRNKALWKVFIDINDRDKLSTDKNTELTFTDTIDPAYTFDLSGSGLDNYIKLYIAYSWGTYLPLTIQPDSNTWTFNKNTVTGKIIITPKEAELLKNLAPDGSYFKIEALYYTQMEEQYYEQFNTEKTGYKNFENTAEVTWEDETHRASSSVSYAPDNSRVFTKLEPIFDPENDIDAYYTLVVNKDGAKLGTGKTITVNDTPGYNLAFNPESVTITPKDGASFEYDEKTRTIKFTLKNETPYTITYSTKVTMLNAYEYDVGDNIDNDRDKELIKRIFTNNAELLYEDNNGDTFSSTAMLKDYRSDVSINSKFSANNDDNSADRETIFLTINKKWDDSRNSSGNINHDEPVVVYLAKYNNKGERVAATKEPPRIAIHPYNNQYYKIIQNLVKYDNQHNPYSYEILTEDELPGYTFSATKMTALNKTVTDINGTEHDAYEINVTNTYNSTNLFVTKNWVDKDSTKRPEEIKFTVWQNGTTKIGDYKITEKNGWEMAIRNLPKFDENNKEYVYTITEDPIEGYIVPDNPVTAAVTANGELKTEVVTFNDEIFPAYTYVLTNKVNTPVPNDKIRLTVKKSWNDKDKTKMRSLFVSFDLYNNDGKLIEDHVGLSSRNGWSHTFFELEKYKTDENGELKLDNDGKKIPQKYFVIEELDNYNYYPNPGEMTESTEAPGEYTITLENIFYPHLPNTTISINVEKQWFNDTEYKNDRGTSVEFVLYQNGKPYNKEYVNQLLPAKQWKTTISGLPMYYINDEGYVDLCEYSIVENPVNNKYEVDNPDPITVSENQTSYDAVISNTHINPDYASISVKKTWKDGKYEDKIDHEKDEVQVQLLRNNGTEGAKDELVEEVTLNKLNEWEHVFDHLEKKDGDNTYTYTVKEVSVNGFAVADGFADRYKVSYTQPAERNNYKAEIINTYIPDTLPNTKVKLDVTKIWNDIGHEKERPESITINVTEAAAKKVTSLILKPTDEASSTWSSSVELPMYYLDDQGIKQLCEYEISEADVIKNYLPEEVDPVKIKEDTLTYKTQIANNYVVPTDEKVDLTVTKKWENKGHTNDIKEIKFNVFRGDTVIGTYSITEENQWKCTVKDLAKSYTTLDGTVKDYDYSIKEIGVDENYTAKESKVDTKDAKEYKATITNTHKDTVTEGTTTPSETTDSNSQQQITTTTGDIVYPVVPPYGYTLTTVTETTTNASDTEDVSAEAGFTEESDAVKRDTIMIFILLGVIITGTSILIYRRHSADYDKKYHM